MATTKTNKETAQSISLPLNVLKNVPSSSFFSVYMMPLSKCAGKSSVFKIYQVVDPPANNVPFHVKALTEYNLLTLMTHIHTQPFHVNVILSSENILFCKAETSPKLTVSSGPE